MRVLHLNPRTGIAGDMLTAALLDLGADRPEFWTHLERLLPPGSGCRAEVRPDCSRGLAGRRFQVSYRHEFIDEAPRSANDPPWPQPGPHQHGEHAHAHAHHQPAHGHAHHGPHRHLADILELIGASALPPRVQERASRAFTLLAEAEGKVHGRPPAEVHFHEVGALDAIVDICGACLAVELLGVARVTSTAPALGAGTVRCQHGVLPVPGPAVAALLAGVPVKTGPDFGELTTPTGAALLRALVDEFTDQVAGRLLVTGYGLGTKELPDRPNALQAMLLEQTIGDDSPTAVAVLECNLDDMPGERLSYLFPKLLEQGALDLIVLPGTMKKSRQGMLLQVLAPPERRAALVELLLRETSTFGVRYHLAERTVLRREFAEAPTPLGPVRVKLGFLPDGELLHWAPEYESCRAVAERSGRPLAEVYELALAARPR